jgi:F-type H+-transporting ATPase subunit delta
MKHIIARRYAKGLMLSAKDSDLENIEQELKALIDVFWQVPLKLFQLFLDPAFSIVERKTVINSIKDRFSMNEVLHSFFSFLIDKNRIMLLPVIYEALVMLIDEHRDRVRANIKSATKVSESQIDAIKLSLMKLCKKDVLIEATVLPELLGGIRVEIGGLIFDGTVKARLLEVQNELLKKLGTIDIILGENHATQGRRNLRNYQKRDQGFYDQNQSN